MDKVEIDRVANGGFGEGEWSGFGEDEEGTEGRASFERVVESAGHATGDLGVVEEASGGSDEAV
jgi:hypothetical protein